MDTVILNWDRCTPKCDLHIIQKGSYVITHEVKPPYKIELKEGTFTAYLCNPEIKDNTRCAYLYNKPTR